ncbi:MAG: hypothetical protein WDM89_12375 [Rhizomicrobium sp.]
MKRLARPRHHLDLAREIAHAPQQSLHLLAARDTPRGITAVTQAVAIANRRPTLASRPLAHLNLMF